MCIFAVTKILFQINNLKMKPLFARFNEGEWKLFTSVKKAYEYLTSEGLQMSYNNAALSVRKGGLIHVQRKVDKHFEFDIFIIDPGSAFLLRSPKLKKLDDYKYLLTTAHMVVYGTNTLSDAKDELKKYQQRFPKTASGYKIHRIR